MLRFHSRSCLCVTAVLSLVVLMPSTGGAQNSDIAFTEHTIATELGGGYQVVATDVNADGRIDLIALASRLSELLWFENPGWERHVLAGDRSGMINLAAHDLDGDGIPEIALAEGFSTRPERSAGIVSILTHQGDPTALWSIREIDRVPTAHRLRWIDPDGSGRRWLVNAALIAADAEAPEYRGETPLYVYDPDDWSRSLIANDAGVVHSVEPMAWKDDDSGEVLMSASFLGVHLHRYADESWTRTRISAGDPSDWPESGSSEVGLGRLESGRFLATIEPWHGHSVIVYRPDGDAWRRDVIDESLTDGHTLVVGDFDGDGRDEFVTGARRGSRVTLYRASSNGDTWSRQVLDEGGVAAAGCVAADFNLDGRLDLACIGSGTANLKWYENATGR